MFVTGLLRNVSSAWTEGCGLSIFLLSVSSLKELEDMFVVMERKTVLVSVAVFLVSAAVGFTAGSPSEGESFPGYREDVDFTANASNPIEEVRFDDRNMSLIVQPGDEAEFFIEVDNQVEPLEGIRHDGNINELTDFVTLEGNMYLLNFRYTDDPEASGDEWITLYRITEL